MKFYQFFQKYGRVSTLGISILVILIAYLVYSSNYSSIYEDEFNMAFQEKSTGVDLSDAKIEKTVQVLATETAEKNTSGLSAFKASNVGYIYTYILIGIAIISALALPILVGQKDLKSLKKLGISIGALLFILLICYLTSSGKAVDGVDGSTVQLSDMIIHSSIVLIIISIVAVVVSEVRSIIKS